MILYYILYFICGYKFALGPESPVDGIGRQVSPILLPLQELLIVLHALPLIHRAFRSCTKLLSLYI